VPQLKLIDADGTQLGRWDVVVFNDREFEFEVCVG
jgi:hypothetical protein